MAFLAVFLFSLQMLWCGAYGLRYPTQDKITFVAGSDGFTTLRDGITTVQPYLTQDQDGTFALGFVSKVPNQFYLSIYWNFPVQGFAEVVWTANRNQPVQAGGYMTFIQNGSLELFNANGDAVWSTNTDGIGTVGLDLDTTYGNCIIYDTDNTTLWQSFDSPTDTLLQTQILQPGMTLVSNLTSQDNSEGFYSLVMEPGGMVVYFTDTERTPYYMWSFYGQNDTFSLKHTCQHPTTMRFMVDSSTLKTPGYLLLAQDTNGTVQPQQESSLLCNISDGNHGQSVQMRTFPNSFERFLRLENDGSLRVYVYNGALNVDYDFFPADQACMLPAICGPYGICKDGGQCSCPVTDVGNDSGITSVDGESRACDVTESVIAGPANATNEAYTCELEPSSSRIAELRGVDYFPNKYWTAPNVTTRNDCKEQCSRNCSCTASFYHEDSGTCFVYYSSLLSLESVGDQSKVAFIKLAGNLDLAQRVPRNFATGILIGILVPTLILLIAFLAFYLMKWRKNRKFLSHGKSEEDAFLESLPGLPPRLSFKELYTATSGFTKTLGSGGFGTVYEGKLVDGTKVAVKKLESLKQGRKEFRAEVATIGSIHHMNLVRLRGFCVEGEHQMLVYEYLANGSLDRWLFVSKGDDIDSTHLLNWGTRFKIAVGTARGLAYLHEECSERILHLDIKPQNILLDEIFSPKVSDFGLAKVTDREDSQVVTTMRGTPGYLAPEWLLFAAVTEKTDVYSYGMVLLEIISGRKNLDIRCTDSEKRYLPSWGFGAVQGGKALSIVDPKLQGDFDEEQIRRAIDIAFLCIQEDMMRRPTMSTVVQMLEGREKVPDHTHLIVQFSSSLGSSTAFSDTTRSFPSTVDSSGTSLF